MFRMVKGSFGGKSASLLLVGIFTSFAWWSSESLAQGIATIGSVSGQSTSQGQTAPTIGEAFSRMLPMLVMVFTIFYFMVIRPQSKRQNLQMEFLRSLKKGDLVVTSGGIHGRIFSIEDGAVHLEIAKDIRIKVDKVALVKPEASMSSDKSVKAT